MTPDRTEIRQAESFGGTPAPGLLRRRAVALARLVTPGPLRRWAKATLAFGLEISTLGRGLQRRLPGMETVRVCPKHYWMAWNLIEYEGFRTVTREGAVVLDVGANAGAYSLLFGKWVGTGGRVFAFEPSPKTHASLVRHIELNGLGGIVEAIPLAVADKAGEAILNTDPADGMHRLTGVTGAGVAVRTTTLDEFCRERGISPSVIKIDVEGFELAVLRGGRHTLRRVGDGLEVFLEIHPSLWPEIGYTREELADELASMGLELTALRPGDPIWTVEGLCLRLTRQAGA